MRFLKISIIIHNTSEEINSDRSIFGIITQDATFLDYVLLCGVTLHIDT